MKLIFVTGGCRSGKSAHALHLAAECGSGGVFLATCPVLDEEMADRVRRHREERRGQGWETVEEQVEVARVLRECAPGSVVLLDCLTLWVNNVLFAGEQAGKLSEENDLARLADELAEAALMREGATIMVGNEVGMGVVPDNALARRFRDLAGRVNQTIAARADAVYFMVAGLATRIK